MQMRMVIICLHYRPAEEIAMRPSPSSSLAPRVALSSRSSETAAPADLSSQDLLRGQRELVIRHGDQLYRLRHTRNDKLILTK